MTEAEYKSQFEPTKYIPYIALTVELWDLFCDDLEKFERVITEPHDMSIEESSSEYNTSSTG